MVYLSGIPPLVRDAQVVRQRGGPVADIQKLIFVKQNNAA